MGIKTAKQHNAEQGVQDNPVIEYWDEANEYKIARLNTLIEEARKAGEVEGYKQGVEMREPYKAGIKRVVDWVEVNSSPLYNIDGSLSDEIMIPKSWQAKLKEWDEKRTHQKDRKPRY